MQESTVQGFCERLDRIEDALAFALKGGSSAIVESIIKHGADSPETKKVMGQLDDH